MKKFAFGIAIFLAGWFALILISSFALTVLDVLPEEVVGAYHKVLPGLDPMRYTIYVVGGVAWHFLWRNRHESIQNLETPLKWLYTWRGIALIFLCNEIIVWGFRI